MDRKQHWEEVYTKRSSQQVSWYRPHLERSLDFILGSHLAPDARIVDIGGGASTLVDDLLDRGYQRVAVIDLSSAALSVARSRLGARASQVDWIVGDATTPLLADKSVDFWHDRAVFHFLTETSARAAYVGQVLRSVKPGGRVLMATFGLDGPEQCSGLPVARYDASGLAATFGNRFQQLDEAREVHETPGGAAQSFMYCLLQRLS